MKRNCPTPNQICVSDTRIRFRAATSFDRRRGTSHTCTSARRTRPGPPTLSCWSIPRCRFANRTARPWNATWNHWRSGGKRHRFSLPGQPGRGRTGPCWASRRPEGASVPPSRSTGRTGSAYPLSLRRRFELLQTRRAGGGRRRWMRGTRRFCDSDTETTGSCSLHRRSSALPWRTCPRTVRAASLRDQVAVPGTSVASWTAGAVRSLAALGRGLAAWRASGWAWKMARLPGNWRLPGQPRRAGNFCCSTLRRSATPLLLKRHRTTGLWLFRCQWVPPTGPAKYQGLYRCWEQHFLRLRSGPTRSDVRRTFASASQWRPSCRARAWAPFLTSSREYFPWFGRWCSWSARARSLAPPWQTSISSASRFSPQPSDPKSATLSCGCPRRPCPISCRCRRGNNDCGSPSRRGRTFCSMTAEASCYGTARWQRTPRVDVLFRQETQRPRQQTDRFFPRGVRRLDVGCCRSARNREEQSFCLSTPLIRQKIS